MASATKGNKVADDFQPSFGPMAMETITKSEAVSTRETAGKPDALLALNAAIDHYGQRKAIAPDIGVSEGYLSKVTSGAQPFPLPLLDRFPRPLAIEFLKAYGRDLEQYRGEGASHKAYVAILAQARVAKALRGEQ